MSEAPSVFPWAKRGIVRGRSKDIVLCCAFSRDDAHVAVGYYDGTFALFDVASMTARGEFTVQHAQAKPTTVTSICFRPTGKPTVLVSSTDGYVDRYDAKTIERVHSIQEHDNEIYSCDYASNGVHFATCGRDATVRVYNDATNELVRVFKLAAEYPTNVAALRLFCVRFDPDNANAVYSAGWGNAVHCHRLEDPPSHDPEGDHRHEFFGAYVTGEAMGIAKGVLVTASNRLDDQLQVWDRETRKPTTVPWPVKYAFLPNCAAISPDAHFVAVGGGGGQGLKEGCFVVDVGSGKAVVDLKLERSVTSCAFAHRDALVAFGDGDGHIHLYENRFAQRTTG